ncbi:hypothetical protein BJ322DRAFT_196553 [Thelephora terrestris]|uniref:Uncharacterized protein n=1 Tax=Thelephora terrestris TaxID=56493 RepID=A0A9P6L492_9AGAM|nr:hypothetical protein BJ322DRAFT_196553 [Thelephora terrestris]
MCPLGRKPLIPLELKINASLILHPLPLTPLPYFFFFLPLLHLAIMSFSVDDLVASLNGNHIGQEAMDLATLQSQLAQSLYCPQETTVPNPNKPGHCNTPLAKTPSSSYMHWAERGVGYPCDTAMGYRSRSSSITSCPRRSRQNSIDEANFDHTHQRDCDMDDMDEDERMVEELLLSASPPSQFHGRYSHQRANSNSGYMASPPTPSSPTIHSDGHFTTSDPFYLAQLQQLQQQQAQNPFATTSSIFGQLGKPTQQSPFAQAPQYHHYSSQQFGPYDVDKYGRGHQRSTLVAALDG